MQNMQIKSLAAIAVLAGLALTAAVPAKGQLINGTFIKGANLPWLDGDYNTWIGIDPTEPGWGCGYNAAHVNQYFADMHDMGISVVRVWINQGDEGDTIDDNDNVTGVTALFWSNMDSCVQLAANNGIKLYVTLNNGREDWLSNPAQADAYKTNALIPMIQRYKGNTAIFAIDLMNEIDGCVQGSLGNYGDTGPTWAQAQAYITDFASAVHGADSNRLVSCSTGWHQWYNLRYFLGLGLDFYDFHNYQDTPAFPSASSLGMDKPVYIGECGQATGEWFDSIQSICELDALNSAGSNGYAGVGIWAYQYPGCSDYHSMVNTNGSWRTVCYTIQSWNYGSSNTYIDVNLLTNPGFELPGTVKISTGYATVPGWANTGTTYTDTGVQPGGHSGSWEGYEQSSDAGAYQIVGNYQIQTGDLLTLTWWSQGEWNGTNSGPYAGTNSNDPFQTVTLLRAAATNTAFSSTVRLALQTNGMPGGTWTPYTLTYTATAADAGKYIGVSFVTSKNSGKTSGTWAGYDDFYLTVVSIPASPGGLAASAVNGQVLLNWNPVANASGYYVKRSLVSGGSYTVIFTNLTSSTFTNTGLANGTTYYYVVSSFNQAGAGTNSTEVSAKPLPIPAVPTGLMAVVTNGQIVLQWNASTYAASYNVFRSVIPGGYAPLTNNIVSTNYTDGSAVPGTTYYYSVAATNMTGQSAYSGQASATVPPPAFGAISLSGTNLIVNGTNGTAGKNYLVLMSGNLALPSSNWTVVATNTFGPGGGFNFTNPVNSTVPRQFYRLKLP